MWIAFLTILVSALCGEASKSKGPIFVPVLGGEFAESPFDVVFPLPSEGEVSVRDSRGKSLPLCSWPHPRGAGRLWGCARGLRAGGRRSVGLRLHSRRARDRASLSRCSAATRTKDGWLLTGRGLRLVVPDAIEVLLGPMRTRVRSPSLLRELRVRAKGSEGTGLECLVQDRRGLQLRKRGVLFLEDKRNFDADIRYDFDAEAPSLRVSMRFTSRNVEGPGVPLRAMALLSNRGRRSLEKRWGKAPCHLKVKRDGRVILPRDAAGLFEPGSPEGAARAAFELGFSSRLHFDFPEALFFTPFCIDQVEAERLEIDLVSAELDWWPGQRAGRELVIGVREKKRASSWKKLTSASRLRESSELLFPDLSATLIETVADKMHADPWRGEANAGDYRWARGRAANLEYDHIGGMLSLAAKGRPASLRAAQRALRHYLDRDLDRNESGLPRRHGSRHRGPIDLGHIWLEGPLDLAWASANRAASEDLVAVIESLRHRIDARGDADWCTLDLSWTLLNLAVLHEYFCAPEDAERIQRLLSLWLDSWRGGWPRLDPLPKGDAVFISSWIGPGVLGEALARLPDSKLRRRARESFGDLLRRIEERVLDPETQQVFRGLVVDAKGSAHASKKVLEGEEIYFLALGLARKSEWAGRPLTAAQRLLRRAQDQIKCEEVRYPGKRLSQLLWVASRRRQGASAGKDG